MTTNTKLLILLLCASLVGCYPKFCNNGKCYEVHTYCNNGHFMDKMYICDVWRSDTVLITTNN